MTALWVDFYIADRNIKHMLLSKYTAFQLAAEVEWFAHKAGFSFTQSGTVVRSRYRRNRLGAILQYCVAWGYREVIYVVSCTII